MPAEIIEKLRSLGLLKRPIQTHPTKHQASKPSPQKFRCEICHLDAADQFQLENHLAGKTHAKELRTKMEQLNGFMSTSQPVLPGQHRMLTTSFGKTKPHKNVIEGVMKKFFENCQKTIF